MGSENSDWKDNDIEFLQEQIKKRPLNRKRMMRRMIIVAVMAAGFGSGACLFFLYNEKLILGKIEQLKGKEA